MGWLLCVYRSDPQSHPDLIRCESKNVISFSFFLFLFCILYLVILPEMSSAERGDGGRPRAGDRGEDLQDWQHD